MCKAALGRTGAQALDQLIDAVRQRLRSVTARYVPGASQTHTLLALTPSCGGDTCAAHMCPAVELCH